jgi:CheY-like chemotaxis protein/nitrogen-specific signal transduction histidine kinase
VLSESFPERLDDGTVVCSGYWADISDRKRMESELLKAKEIAEAATHAKAMFLANMSHEIRTPMNAILGMAYLALQGELPPTERDYVRNIQTAARSLLGIVNDILDFSKMDAGHLRLKHIPLDLSEVVASVVSLAMVQANEKGLRLVSRVDPDIPHPLIGDPIRLGQVLTNLANNAIKFTDEGEVTLVVDLLENDARECAVRFSVSDTGVGLLPEQQTGLFEAFSQVDGSTTRHHGGTGLGLSICKQLVGLMGGEIKMHSVYGEGSTFSFELRFARAEEPQGTAPDIEEIPDFGGRTVLLVDDNEFNRIVTREVLAIANLDAIAVESGPEAIEVLRNDVDGKIALILLDVQLPEMDGYEVARRVRSMPGLATLPIVAMTAHALSEVREQCLQAGMDDYISKPVDPPLLYRLIASWLLADANDSSED